MPTHSSQHALEQYIEAKQRRVAWHAGQSHKQSWGLAARQKQLVPQGNSRKTNVRPEKKRLVQENNKAELQRQLLFIPPYASPDRSGEGRDERGNETQWPMSLSINWPWLFHAVVGLRCWHISRLRKKIVMELCQKPRREGAGKGSTRQGNLVRCFDSTTMFSGRLCSHAIIN